MRAEKAEASGGSAAPARGRARPQNRSADASEGEAEEGEGEAEDGEGKAEGEEGEEGSDGGGGGGGGDGDGAGVVRDDEGSEASSDGALEENEAVVVQWKKKAYNGVVTALKPRSSRGVQVQFDVDHNHAWVSAGAVRRMDEAAPSVLPAWARVGCTLYALDPSNHKSGWHEATVKEALHGVSDGEDDDGVRLWVRYAKSGLCEWVRRPELTNDSADAAHGGSSEGTRRASPAARSLPKGRRRGAAEVANARKAPKSEQGALPSGSSDSHVVDISCRSGCAGSRIWLLLDPAPQNASFSVTFGEAATAYAHLLAPNVVSCTVPPDAAPGPTTLQLCARPHKKGGASKPKLVALPSLCSTLFEVLDLS